MKAEPAIEFCEEIQEIAIGAALGAAMLHAGVSTWTGIVAATVVIVALPVVWTIGELIALELEGEDGDRA